MWVGDVKSVQLNFEKRVRARPEECGEGVLSRQESVWGTRLACSFGALRRHVDGDGSGLHAHSEFLAGLTSSAVELVRSSAVEFDLEVATLAHSRQG